MCVEGVVLRSPPEMKFAIVTHSIPQPHSNGGPLTCWALAKQLAEDGHDTVVIALEYPGAEAAPEASSALQELGVSVATVRVPPDGVPTTIPGTLASDGRGDLEALFPTVRLGDELAELIAEHRPDATFVYHWDSLAAMHGVGDAPKLGVVDDLWHHPNLRRWQATRPSPSRAYAAWTLATLRGIRPVRRAMAELLADCTATGSFQAQAAEKLRRWGRSPSCTYYPAPVDDGGGPDWSSRRRENPAVFRVLLGPSSLNTTSTSAGLRFFATDVLPRLEGRLSRPLQVRIVGDGTPPRELARMLPREDIALVGRVEPPDDEFLRCDVQLVPTPFVLGKRVRIIVGWSYGCCVLAHANETVNLPELRDGSNGLIGRSGAEIADALVRIESNPALAREMQEGGRRTYEQVFAPHVAARTIEADLVALAHRHSVAELVR
jgi:hypothetical protein